MVENIEYGTNWALAIAAIVMGIGLLLIVTAILSELGGNSTGDRWSIGISLIFSSFILFIFGLALVGGLCGIYAVGLKVWSQIVILNSPSLIMKLFTGACLLAGAIWQIAHWIQISQRFEAMNSGSADTRDLLSLMISVGFPIVACVVGIILVIRIDYQLAMGYTPEIPVYLRDFVGRGMYKAHVWFGQEFPSESPTEGWFRPMLWVALRGIPYWLAAGVSFFVVFLYAALFPRFSLVAIAILSLQQAFAGHLPDIAAYFNLLIQVLLNEEWDLLAIMLATQSLLQTLIDFRR